jgi:hypothetical protein
MKKGHSRSKEPKAKAWGHNAVEASRELKVTRLTLRRWLDLEGTPGRNAAGKYDLRAWKAWMLREKPHLNRRYQGEEFSPASRKQEISIEIAEIELRKAKREESLLTEKYMTVDEVDGFMFEILANLDFQLHNAERAITLEVARKFKVDVREVRTVVKLHFDGFRIAWLDQPLSQSVKSHINYWMALPFALREKIMVGQFSAKEQESR